MTRRNQAGFSLLGSHDGGGDRHGASTPSGVVAYVKAAIDTTAYTSQNSQVYYFYDNRPGSLQGWGAMSISPAGRLKKWYWTGSVWAS